MHKTLEHKPDLVTFIVLEPQKIPYVYDYEWSQKLLVYLEDEKCSFRSKNMHTHICNI